MHPLVPQLGDALDDTTSAGTSTYSPRRSCAGQLDNCCAVTAWRRATLLTLAPATRFSEIIRALTLSGHRRRPSPRSRVPRFGVLIPRSSVCIRRVPPWRIVWIARTCEIGIVHQGGPRRSREHNNRRCRRRSRCHAVRNRPGGDGARRRDGPPSWSVATAGFGLGSRGTPRCSHHTAVQAAPSVSHAGGQRCRTCHGGGPGRGARSVERRAPGRMEIVLGDDMRVIVDATVHGPALARVLAVRSTSENTSEV